MIISQDDLRSAAAGVGVSAEQADKIWLALEAQTTSAAQPPRFDLVHVLYYFGALIVIGAMGWFMNLAWESLGGGGIFIISVAYAACFLAGGRTLWQNPGFRVPGGLLFTMAVAMTPLAIYGLERLTGFWPGSDPGAYQRFHPYINSSWVIMEVATVIAGLAVLRFWRFPFITAPIAWALWFLSMDLVELIDGHTVDWAHRQIISAIFGAIVLCCFYLVDLRGKSGEDFSFWGYLLGLMAFWGSLSFMDNGSELAKVGYCLINLGLIFCSLVLQRRTFLVFGVLGVFGYLGYLAHRVFENSMLFPFVLTLAGLALIYLGVQYQKYKYEIDRAFRARVFPHISAFVPPRVRNLSKTE